MQEPPYPEGTQAEDIVDFGLSVDYMYTFSDCTQETRTIQTDEFSTIGIGDRIELHV